MAAAVEHRHRVADAEPQHARQVLAFVARQGDGLVAGIERRAQRSGARRRIIGGLTQRRAGRYTSRRQMFFRGQIIGKYKILSTIGSGGFGTVYLAEDTWIDKKVALKVPHKQRRRLRRAAARAAAARQPESSEHRHAS